MFNYFKRLQTINTRGQQNKHFFNALKEIAEEKEGQMLALAAEDLKQTSA